MTKVFTAGIVSHEAGPAMVDTRGIEAVVTAFVERVRDEWEARRQPARRPPGSDLSALLLRGPAPRRPPQDEAATFMRDGFVESLPRERLDRSGAVHPIDAAFFARRQYDIADLDGFSDAVFLHFAFRCLLKRSPDPFGYGNALRGLQDGVLDRVDVLRGLCASPEGRRVGVVVPRLWWHSFWRRAGRVPAIGPSIGWLRSLAGLSRIDKRLRILESRTGAWRDDVDRRILLVSKERAAAPGSEPEFGFDAAVLGLDHRIGRLQAEARIKAADAESRAAQMDRHLVALTEASRAAHERIERLEATLRLFESAELSSRSAPPPVATPRDGPSGPS